MAALQGAATAAACSPAQVLSLRPQGLQSRSAVLPRGRWVAGSRASRTVCVASLSVGKSEASGKSRAGWRRCLLCARQLHS